MDKELENKLHLEELTKQIIQAYKNDKNGVTMVIKNLTKEYNLRINVDLIWERNPNE